MKSTLPTFNTLNHKYKKIYLIVSPPRCGSTAFARVFWEHPSIRYYSHEPFETTYYANSTLDDAYQRIEQALDLLPVKSEQAQQVYANHLVIKEMPYQIGHNFSMTLEWVEKPIIFLIRNPKLNIASRIKKKLETGDSPFFPLKETGWELIRDQIQVCKQQNIPYLIVDSSDFRNHPTEIFQQVFKRLDLTFHASQLVWKADQTIKIDNLDGVHEHLYKKVLGSRSIQPATEPIPELESFTTEKGMRQHVADCLAIYQELLKDQNRIYVA